MKEEKKCEIGTIVSIQDGCNIVKESNRLIYSCYSMTEVEQKLMYCFIRHIQNDKEIQRYSIPVREIQTVCGFSETKFHTQIAQAADKLMSRVVTMYLKEKDSWIKANWLSFIQYQNGMITFEFNNALKDELLQLQNRFTIFDVRVPLRLTGIYTSRLYLLFKQLQKLNAKLHIITVNELKNIFELTPAMSNSSKIRERILDPSIEQINKYTDLQVKYTPLKDGKNIISFQFTIKSNNKNIEKFQAEGISEKRKKILSEMEYIIFNYCKIPSETLEQWTINVPDDVLESYLRYTYKIAIERKKQNAIKGDLKSYFCGILRRVIADPEEALKDNTNWNYEDDNAYDEWHENIIVCKSE